MSRSSFGVKMPREMARVTVVARILFAVAVISNVPIVTWALGVALDHHRRPVIAEMATYVAMAMMVGVPWLILAISNAKPQKGYFESSTRKPLLAVRMYVDRQGRTHREDNRNHTRIGLTDTRPAQLLWCGVAYGVALVILLLVA